MSRYLIRVIFGAVLMLFGAGLIVGFVAGRASAQAPSPLGQGDHHHPLHRDFYRNWMQPGVTPPVSCCNARTTQQGVEVGDCEPAPAEVRAGQWWVWVRQIPAWLAVPDGKIIREPNPNVVDGHVCWTPASGILCFKPPDTGG